MWPKAISQLELPISKKSWDKFLGEARRILIGTLGGAAFPVAGVTTLGGDGESWLALTVSGTVGLNFVCDLVWYWPLIGDIKGGGIVRSWSLVLGFLFAAAGETGADPFLNFLVKMADKVARAEIVSSPMVAKGTSGCGCFRASVMSWAAINSRSVNDICGISEL